MEILRIQPGAEKDAAFFIPELQLTIATPHELSRVGNRSGMSLRRNTANDALGTVFAMPTPYQTWICQSAAVCCKLKAFDFKTLRFPTKCQFAVVRVGLQRGL